MDRGIRGQRLSGQVAGASVAALPRAARIPADLATRSAYNFGRSLRRRGSEEADFNRLLGEWVDRRFAGTALLPHVRAGFTAGFAGAPLPSAWTYLDPET